MVILSFMNDLLTKRLRDLRNEKDLKQSEVANLANIEPNTYGRYERGERVPTTENVMALAKVFNCTTDYLLGNTDNRNEDLNITDKERIFLETYAEAQKSDKETVKDMLKIINNILGIDE